MNAKVTYNEDGEPDRIVFDAPNEDRIILKMVGTSAVLDDVCVEHNPDEQKSYVNLERLRNAVEYVENLDFVQSVSTL